jgi:hypothetical protein
MADGELAVSPGESVLVHRLLHARRCHANGGVVEIESRHPAGRKAPR